MTRKDIETYPKSSTDTYDSDIDLEDIVWQTERHFEQLKEEMENNRKE